MPLPDMAVLAEGGLPTGQRWVLRAGGTSSDFYTFLQTIHPDGHRDEGGMGGPPLYPGSLMNTYTGRSEQGMRRVLVRADPHVARVRVHLGSQEQLDLPPVAARPDLGLVFFATLLPRPPSWSRSSRSMRTDRCCNRSTFPAARQAGSISCDSTGTLAPDDPGRPEPPP
jgi:hypothetical protein